MDNPFSYGNPIRDPARFHGRQAELRQIVNRMHSSASESTSIVAPVAYIAVPVVNCP